MISSTNLVFVRNSNLAGVVGHIYAGYLDVVVADTRDDLDPLEVVGEDRDVAASSVRGQPDT